MVEYSRLCQPNEYIEKEWRLMSEIRNKTAKGFLVTASKIKNTNC
jgi:hypothetical protein